MCTVLAPVLGYDQAAALSKEAFKTGRTIREIVRERGLIAEDKLNQLLDAKRMTYPEE